MSKDAKLLDKIRNNPKSVSFQDLDKMLISFGFQRRQPKSGSSHYIYTRGPHSLTVPFKRPHVKEYYVKAALSLIDQALQDEDLD
jgi:hypothetical protein